MDSGLGQMRKGDGSGIENESDLSLLLLIWWCVHGCPRVILMGKGK